MCQMFPLPLLARLFAGPFFIRALASVWNESCLKVAAQGGLRNTYLSLAIY